LIEQHVHVTYALEAESFENRAPDRRRFRSTVSSYESSPQVADAVVRERLHAVARD
jgi:hypothetical protein